MQVVRRVLDPLAASLAVAVLLGSATTAAAQAPLWAKLLRWMSGDSDQTPVPHSAIGVHVQMSLKRPPRPDDDERAERIVAAAREVLRRHPDVASATRDGYRPFHQTGQLGEEVHYTSIGYGYAEGKRVDYLHPGSLLFQRTRAGMVPVGVMYSASNASTADNLDLRAPLSVATWHRHVDFCLPVGRDAKAKAEDPRFGYAGSIHSEAACAQAGGYWIPVAFGWMTHVYPDDTGKVWGGEDMDMSDMHDHH